MVLASGLYSIFIDGQIDLVLVVGEWIVGGPRQIHCKGDLKKKKKDLHILNLFHFL